MSQGPPLTDREALLATLAQRAREHAGFEDAAGKDGEPGEPAPLPEPEELLDFLDGRLSSQEAECLERRLLADPEAARALLDLADFEQAVGQLDEPPGQQSPRDLLTHAGWRDFEGRRRAAEGRSKPWRLWLPTAVAAVLAMGVGLLGLRVVMLEREIGQPVTNLRSLELAAGNRAGGEPVAEVAAGEPLLLVFLPEARCEEYQGVLEGPTAAAHQPLHALRRDPLGRLTVQLRPSPGAYTLELSACGPGGSPQSYRFRVIRPPPARGGDVR